jgi:hypothetical protein
MMWCRVLPMAEVIMCCGFLFICILEEIIHHFIHPHKVFLILYKVKYDL